MGDCDLSSIIDYRCFLYLLLRKPSFHHSMTEARSPRGLSAGAVWKVRGASCRVGTSAQLAFDGIRCAWNSGVSVEAGLLFQRDNRITPALALLVAR